MKESAHRVLVTGASVLIDSHLRARLVKEGYSVRALDAAHCSWEWTSNQECNSSEATSGIKSIASGAAKGMVVIVHLAALKEVRETIKHPTLYPDINATGTLRLLEATHKAGVKRFIFASTCAVYGEAERVPIDENLPPDPSPLRGQQAGGRSLLPCLCTGLRHERHHPKALQQMQARTTKQLRRRDTEIHQKGVAIAKMLGLGKGFMVVPSNGKYYKI
jgi:hypothetical protein